MNNTARRSHTACNGKNVHLGDIAGSAHLMMRTTVEQMMIARGRRKPSMAKEVRYVLTSCKDDIQHSH